MLDGKPCSSTRRGPHISCIDPIRASATECGRVLWASFPLRSPQHGEIQPKEGIPKMNLESSAVEMLPRPSCRIRY